MHHVAYRVADIDAAFAALLARGVEMIDAAPRPGLRDSRIDNFRDTSRFLYRDSNFGAAPTCHVCLTCDLLHP